MKARRTLILGTFCASLLAACGDDPEVPDVGTVDTGQPADSGFDAGLEDSGHDAGFPDTGVLPDAGSTIALFSGSRGGAGDLDGQRPAARFSGPGAVARAPDGTVYVADTSNYTIRKITVDGEVTTIAGSPGRDGVANGTGGAARFNLPTAIAIDPSGDLIVSDSYSGTLRKVTPTGAVTTWAGVPNDYGNVDGPLAQARFRSPEGLAFDNDGNLYVADREAHTIRKITPAGMVTTFVGTDMTPGSDDGPRESALLTGPFGVATSTDGAVAIADAGNNTIRWVDANGEVTTLAGTAGEGQDITDGTGPAARFGRPRALTFLADGSLIIADTFNDRLRRLTRSGVVTTYAGSFAGAVDGPLLDARLSFPSSVFAAIEAGEEVVYVADTGSGIIRRATATTLTTFAGAAADVGLVDGLLPAARYYGPAGMLLRQDGSILVADAFNNAIRKISDDGEVSTISGDPLESIHVDGPLADARYFTPTRFLEDVQGAYFIADSANNRIRRVTAQGVVSTFAGGENQRGQTRVDGPLLDARFFAPSAMVKDLFGVIYVVDTGNHAIRRIGLDGMVTTIAGDGLPDYIEGPGDMARFNAPDGLVMVNDRLMIVADTGNSVLRKVQLDIDGNATVSLFAGRAPIGAEPRPGDADGTAEAASFRNPADLLLAEDAILVADRNNNLIRRVTIDGAVVTTVAGTRGLFGIRDGELPGVLFEPGSMFRYPNGDLLVSSFGAIQIIHGL